MTEGIKINIHACVITQRAGDTWFDDLTSRRDYSIIKYRILPLEDYNSESLWSFIKRRYLGVTK